MLIVQNQSRRTPVTAFVIAAIVIVSAVVAWMTSSTPDVPDLPTGDGAAAASVAARTAAPTRPTVPGVPVDGPTAPPPEDPARVFDLGFAGGLLIDASTVTALDRLHSMLGENPTPDDIARLERQLREGLPREDADKAIKLVHGYRGYSQDMRTQVMAMGVPQTREEANQLLAQVAAVQQKHFDPASADAMFGDQNRLSRVVLEAALVQNDTTLTDSQKKVQLDALRYSLPENQRQAVPDMPSANASAPQ